MSFYDLKEIVWGRVFLIIRLIRSMASIDVRIVKKSI